MRKDKELVSIACLLMSNCMETGDPILSSNDIKAMHNPKKKLRLLDEEQKKEVDRLRRISELVAIPDRRFSI